MLLGHNYNNQPVFLNEHDLDRHAYVIGSPAPARRRPCLPSPRASSPRSGAACSCSTPTAT